ncbi:MAG: hypothetical protein R3F62_11430 [Planctomycetota bacterium]
MTAPLDDFVPLLRLTTGRRLYALREVHDLLAGAGLEALRREAARAIEADEATSDLELSWAPARRAQHAPGARSLAADLTRALSALAGFLRSLRSSFGDAPQGRRAAWVEARLLPLGVGPLLRQPYVQQASDVQVCLQRLEEEPGLREAVDDLGATILTDRLRDVVARFAETLERPAKARPFAEVAAARDAGHQALRRLVLLLLAQQTLCEDATEAEALRDALAAVQAQKASATRLRKRRRARKAAAPEPARVEREAPAREAPPRPSAPRLVADPAAPRSQPLRLSLRGPPAG